MEGGTRVRVFPAGDFAAPTGWPDEVGVAVIKAGGIEVFPVHARETTADILRRIADLSGVDLRNVPVHPAADGHPPCDLPFSAVAALQSSVEDFLSRYPEAIDEADDFAVNFGFAVEEGIAFPALVLQDAAAAPPRDIAPPRADAGLAGYRALTPDAVPVPPRFGKPVLRVSPDGALMVVLDPDNPVLAATTPPVLLRDDGLGLAVPRAVLHGPDGVLRGLRLPTACLPWLPRDVEGDLPLLAVESGDYLLLSLLPEWAWPVAEPARSLTEPAAAEDAPNLSRLLPNALRSLVNSGWRTRVTGFAALSVLVVGAGLGLAQLGDAGHDIRTSAAPVDALRAGLFD